MERIEEWGLSGGMLSFWFACLAVQDAPASCGARFALENEFYLAQSCKADPTIIWGFFKL